MLRKKPNIHHEGWYMLQWLAMFTLVMLCQMSYASGILVSVEGPGSPDGGVGDQFASSRVSATLPVDQGSNKHEQVRTYAHIDYTRFLWQGAQAADKDYFWLSLPINYQQQRGDDSAFLLDIEPGLMTDMNALGTDALAANIAVSGRSYFGAGDFLQYGVIINRSLGDYKPRPSLAVTWQASQASRITFGFPYTQIYSRLSPGLSSFLRIRPAGGVWKESVEGQDKPQSINYRNWRFGIGGEFRWRSSLWLKAEIGQVRNRTIEAFDKTGVRQVSRPGDDRFWQFGLSLKI